MMAAGFLQILDMTKTGTSVILVVLVARLLVWPASDLAAFAG